MTVSRSASPDHRPVLRGRTRECALLDGLIADVRGGGSRSLVLHGEAGIGKTALLEYLIASASELTVVRASGVESEMELYRHAIERLGRTRLRTELARAHLLYGEWLRRDRRRLDAREELRTAQVMFTEIGMEAFGERTRKELLATGETARKRTPETRDELTAQETQIAQFAREGLPNVEIGARLFISPRTVEYHLHKVFTKLGITTREHLDRVLPGG
jgi:DNA-binding CsgD family transcriptional regulator